MLKSNVQLLNSESVQLRKAHDNAMKELDQYKDENRRLTEQLLKLKESQMDQMDQLNQEYEKFRKINAAKIKQQSEESEMKLNEPIPRPQHQRRHTTVPNQSMNDYYGSNNNNNQKKSNSQSPQGRNRWSIASLFGGKDDKKGGNNNNNNNHNDGNGRVNKSQSVDFSAHRAPIVDLYGPSLFNITPPQLVM